MISNRHFITSNAATGVEATVYERVAGNYSVVVRDTDADKTIGVKYFSTLTAAINYAKLCVKG